MSETGSETQSHPRIIVHDQEIVTEPLNGKIQIKFYPDSNRTVLRVGNTGLSIFLDKDQNSSVNVHTDFMPEDKASPNNNPIKSSVIFGYALTKFYDWSKDLENFSSLGLNIENIQKVASPSNPVMITFMHKILSRFGHGDLMSIDDKDRILFDWKRLLSLEETDPLIQFLRKLEQRGERMSVSYSKSTG